MHGTPWFNSVCLTRYRKQYDDKTVLVLYGGLNEHHEIAVEDNGKGNYTVLQGKDAKVERAKDGYIIISTDISDDTSDRNVVRIRDNFYIYILSRSSSSDLTYLHVATTD